MFFLKASLAIPVIILTVCTLVCILILRIHTVLLLYLYTHPEIKRSKEKLTNTSTIEEYAAIATELDRQLGLIFYKNDTKAQRFNKIQLWTRAITVHMNYNLIDQLCELLLQCQKTDHAGVLDPPVYGYAFWNTNECVVAYHKQLIIAMDYIADYTVNVSNPPLKILSFISQMNLLWCRTALTLQCSKHNQFYQLGVCCGLLRIKSVPRIIYATGLNALVAAWIAVNAENHDNLLIQNHIYEALRIFDGREKWYYIRQSDRKAIILQLNQLFGELTMLDLYNLNGRQLNLLCYYNSQKFIINYKTCPDTLISSCVLSCICKDVLQPGVHSPWISKNPHPFWGIVVNNPQWINFWDISPKPGFPQDTLPGTPCQESMLIISTLLQTLNETMEQLIWIISSVWQLQDQIQGWLTNESPFFGSCAGGAIYFHPRNRTWKWWLSRRSQLSMGIQHAFQHSCLIQIRMDIEERVNRLIKAASHVEQENK